MDTAEIVSTAFGLWLFVAGAFLPRVIPNLRILCLTILAVGAVLGYLDVTMHVRPPWWIMATGAMLLIATGLAAFHSETLFRRKNGYWRVFGPPVAHH